MSIKSTDVAIIGAGISGLACAANIENRDVTAFEKHNYIGGLCHSFSIDGFTFDTAVHLSFTKIDEAIEFFHTNPMIKHKPLSFNYYKNIWLKHPFINNLFPLANEEKYECLTAYVKREEKKEITNYADWLKSSYGEAFYEKFYKVYTEKYWAVMPNEMSTEWIGNRLANTNIDKILYGMLFNETGNDYYANEMFYPKSSGYESVLAPLLPKVNVNLEYEVEKIDIRDKTIHFSNGEGVRYKKLISSLPLPQLVQCTKNVPKEVALSASKLKATAMSLVSVGFNKPNIGKHLWFYIYDKDIFAARVNSPSVKNPNNVPEGCSSLQFEIYSLDNTAKDKQTVLDNVRYAIEKMQICNPEDILFMDYRYIPYANVIFTDNILGNREKVLTFYNEHNVSTIGRFGEWDYLWSDQSYVSGINEAKKINKQREGDTDV